MNWGVEENSSSSLEEQRVAWISGNAIMKQLNGFVPRGGLQSTILAIIVFFVHTHGFNQTRQLAILRNDHLFHAIAAMESFRAERWIWISGESIPPLQAYPRTWSNIEAMLLRLGSAAGFSISDLLVAGRTATVVLTFAVLSHFAAEVLFAKIRVKSETNRVAVRVLVATYLAVGTVGHFLQLGSTNLLMALGVVMYLQVRAIQAGLSPSRVFFAICATALTWVPLVPVALLVAINGVLSHHRDYRHSHPGNLKAASVAALFSAFYALQLLRIRGLTSVMSSPGFEPFELFVSPNIWGIGLLSIGVITATLLGTGAERTDLLVPAIGLIAMALFHIVQYTELLRVDGYYISQLLLGLHILIMPSSVGAIWGLKRMASTERRTAQVLTAIVLLMSLPLDYRTTPPYWHSAASSPAGLPGLGYWTSAHTFSHATEVLASVDTDSSLTPVGMLPVPAMTQCDPDHKDAGLRYAYLWATILRGLDAREAYETGQPPYSCTQVLHATQRSEILFAKR